MVRVDFSIAELSTYQEKGFYVIVNSYEALLCREDFGLSGREGAALLVGGHSFGTFNYDISQFKYDWTRNQASMLNNQLFR